MKLFTRNAPAVAIIGVILLSSSVRGEAVSHLVPFQLKDQFGQELNRTELEGRVVVLVVGGRSAKQISRAWGDHLRMKLSEEIAGGNVRIIPVADLSAYPALLKKPIRSFLSEDTSRHVLLDWKGAFQQAYDLDPGVSSLLVADSEGRLSIERFSEPPSAAEKKRIVSTVRYLVQNVAASDGP